MIGWTASTLGEIGDALIGLTYSPSQVTHADGTLVLRSSNIQGGQLALDDTVYVNAQIPERIRVRASDILICVRNGSRPLIGKSLYLDGRVEGETFGAFMAVFRSPLNHYLRYFFQSDEFKRQVDEHLGATINQITNKSLKGFTVVYPDQRERSEIARRLADIDGLIDSLSGLIAKKRAVAQAMLHATFGASHPEPELVALGSVAGFLSGGTPNRMRIEYWDGDIPWLSATTLKKLEVSESDQHVTRQAVIAGSKMAPLGSTLVLVRGSALHSEIRASLVVAPVCFNQDVKALVPVSRIIPKFLTYSIHAYADRLLRVVTSAGNTAGVLDTKVLKRFVLWVPSREQQTQLVSVFDDVTAEIEALERRLVSTRAIKQGMMQELLTGRTRLVREGAA